MRQSASCLTFESWNPAGIGDKDFGPLQSGLLVDVQNDRYARSLKGDVRAQTFAQLFYDGQVDGLTLEAAGPVFRCFSSARLASIRLSLALS